MYLVAPSWITQILEQQISTKYQTPSRLNANFWLCVDTTKLSCGPSSMCWAPGKTHRSIKKNSPSTIYQLPRNTQVKKPTFNYTLSIRKHPQVWISTFNHVLSIWEHPQVKKMNPNLVSTSQVGMPNFNYATSQNTHKTEHRPSTRHETTENTHESER